mmetsp:Transcript_132194/g.422932  ORF Transcript_132194/g.422932 Transcript_132194/m.422932 type:complete len:217 (-) Transcript_132194:567-1217(-)
MAAMRRSRSSPSQCTKAARTTCEATRCLARRWMSLYNISATTLRCGCVPCSRICCTTKLPKVCRQSWEAPAKISSRMGSVCQLGQCSMRRSRTRQPKRWRAVMMAWPFISSKMNCRLSGGSTSTHFCSTWFACGDIVASNTRPRSCSATAICSWPEATSMARCTTRQPAGEAASGQAWSMTHCTAVRVREASCAESSTKMFSHSASEGDSTLSALL